jgi:hypothetical protein
LEKEEILQQFDQIEQRIGRLIEVSKSLETTNQELERKIESLEKELKEKNLSEKNYLDERNLIRSKVDNLLARLQEITEASK